MALADIRKKIEQDAANEAAKLLDEAKAQAAALEKEAEAEIAKSKAYYDGMFAEEAPEVRRRAQIIANLDVKKISLGAKQELIGKAFDGALDRLCSLDDGKYGKGVINNSRIKFILQLEEDEAFAVQKYMALSDEETMQIIRNQRGEALLCANRNKVCIDIKASPMLYHMLTTKRSDLEKRKRK